MNFEIISVPRPAGSGCGSAALLSVSGNLGRAGTGTGREGPEAVVVTRHRVPEKLARGESQMREMSSRKPGKVETVPETGNQENPSLARDEEAARLAEIERAAENLRRIAGTPEHPVEQAIERAHLKMRWRNIRYTRKLWYGELHSVPAHISRRLEQLATAAVAEQIAAHEHQAAVLRKLLPSST